jgi:tetratricopeptide (TPR) repeat protein/O-antigen ligase
MNDSFNSPLSDRSQTRSDGSNTSRGITITILRYIITSGIGATVLALFPYSAECALDAKYLILMSTSFVAAIVFGWGCVNGYIVPKLPPELTVTIGLFCLWQYLSLFQATNVLLGVLAATRFSCLAVIIVITSSVFREPAQAWRAILFLIFVTAVTNVYGLVQLFGWDPFPWQTRDVEEYLNLPSTFGNPNFAAHFILIMILASVGLATRRSTHWVFLLVALSSFHLYMTSMRAAVLALTSALGVILVAWSVKTFNLTPRIAVIRTLTISISIAFISFLLAVCGEYYLTGHALPLDGSVILRYNSNVTASKVLVDSPILGVGTGNYVVASPPYWTSYEKLWYATNNSISTHVHNEYMEFAAEGGYPLLALYTLLIVFTLARCLFAAFGTLDPERRRLGFTLAACITGFAVDSFLGFNLHAPASAALFAFFVGLAMSISESRVSVRRNISVVIRGALAALLILVTAVGIAFEIRQFASQVFVQQSKAIQNSPVSADSSLASAARLAPWDWNTHTLRGNIAINASNSELARLHYARALDANPSCVPGLLGSARARVLQVKQSITALPAERKSQLDEARSFVVKAIQLVPELSRCREALADIELTEGQLAEEQHDPHGAREHRLEAVEQLRRSIVFQESDESLARTYKSLAAIQMTLGDAPQAISALHIAAFYTPSDSALWALFFQVIMQTKNTETMRWAIENSLGRVKKTEPDGARAWAIANTWLARLFMYDGETEKANELLRPMLDNPNSPLEAWGFYAQSLSLLQRDSELEKRLKNHTIMYLDPLTSNTVFAVSQFLTTSRPDVAVNATAILANVANQRSTEVAPEVLAAQFGWVVDIAEAELMQSNVLDGQKRAIAFANLAAIARACGNNQQVVNLCLTALITATSDVRERVLQLKESAETIQNRPAGTVEVERHAN